MRYLVRAPLINVTIPPMMIIVEIEIVVLLRVLREILRAVSQIAAVVTQPLEFYERLYRLVSTRDQKSTEICPGSIRGRERW